MKLTPTLLLTTGLIFSASLLNAASYTLENNAISRTLSTDSGHLITTSIRNKKAGTTLTPTACAEFALRISQGTDKVGTDVILTSADFDVVKPLTSNSNELKIRLHNTKYGITVDADYTLKPNQSVLRKRLTITSEKPICLERIDVEALSFPDAYQPYKIKQINARGGWRPGLGQPLFTTKSATFWGIEFPAAVNFVNGEKLRCGYLQGKMLAPSKPYSSYQSVVGVSDDPEFISDAFYDYINTIRIRPLRLQRQYNSWFDYGKNINKTQFINSVNKVNQELCLKRGVSPLSAYVIDDGWQASWQTPQMQKDWSKGVWPVNNRFDQDFASSNAAVKAAKSTRGLWLSPGCNFNAKPAVPHMRKHHMGALGEYMSLADTPYMDMLEKRMVELTQSGTTYFKLDGLFGHLYIREFDIHGVSRNMPTMPQLGLDGFSPSDKRLNDHKYDELKTYYLTAGTERLIKIFHQMAATNPDVYIVISNGAYLSPWWLMSIDTCWMINAGDAASGSDRTGELVYRDGVYHEIYAKENTHFPMNSLFNHEPKKRSSKETKQQFRSYLYMNMSRGTGFVELYLRTFKLQDYDWDVLAEGLLWVEDVFPTFSRSRMHGGNPRKKQVYGYTAWNKSRGYISIHNPADKPQTYTITLDRKFGLLPGTQSYFLSSPMDASLAGLKPKYNFGDTISLTLQPREVRILNFDSDKKHDWSKLKALQTRTKADYKPAP